MLPYEEVPQGKNNMAYVSLFFLANLSGRDATAFFFLF